MKNTLEPWKKYHHNLDDEISENASEIQFFSNRGRLLYECLRLSPSLIAAFQFFDRDPTELDYKRTYIPPDLHLLRRTIVKLGFKDKMSFNFGYWWDTYGKDIFYGSLTSPDPEVVATLTRLENINEQELINKISEYNNRVFNDTRANEALLIAIPLQGNERFLLKRVDNILKAHRVVDGRNFSSAKVISVRFQEDVITKRLRLLWLRAMHPKLALYKLGADAGVSNKYPNWESVALAIADPNESDPTNSLAKQTIRALREAVNTVENAARSRFPDHTSDTFPPDYDYKIILDAIIRNRIQPRIKKHEESTYNRKRFPYD